MRNKLATVGLVMMIGGLTWIHPGLGVIGLGFVLALVALEMT